MITCGCSLSAQCVCQESSHMHTEQWTEHLIKAAISGKGNSGVIAEKCSVYMHIYIYMPVLCTAVPMYMCCIQILSFRLREWKTSIHHNQIPHPSLACSHSGCRAETGTAILYWPLPLYASLLGLPVPADWTTPFVARALRRAAIWSGVLRPSRACR